MPIPPSLPQVVAVEVIGDHELRLTFDDGVIGDVGFVDGQWRGVLEPLRDQDFFAKVGLKMGTVCWPGDLDLAPEPLYEEARRHWVQIPPGSAPICVRCELPVVVSEDDYETFERMHWVCFHFAFEHSGDPDAPCRDPSCPMRRNG